MRPVCIDLFCGLGGWADGFLAEGYDVIGFDIERHDYGTGGYPGWLVLQDIRTLHGSQFKDATVIVGSSPCQKYSYMAMPWSKAKQIAHEYRTGIRSVEELNELFNAQFRIQREACEAAGRYIPLIVENVRGAQLWVGQSRWHYGSFHLWGDVPALMPITVGRKNSGGSWFNVAHNTTSGKGQNAREQAVAGLKVSGFRFDGSGRSFQSESVRQISEGWLAKHYDETEKMQLGRKQEGSGPIWFDQGIARHGSKSNSRKAASAQIAKIPFPLARHIAKCFKPQCLRETSEVSG